MDADELAKHINAEEPLNRFSIKRNIEDAIGQLSIEGKINLLVFSFQNYDKTYNKNLCLTYPNVWGEFTVTDWEKLILRMFPRKVKFLKNDLREINTGSYSDIFLLNGIIGISPFEFIFQNSNIEHTEKKSFLNYLKFYGEVCFFYNEREMIDDIVNFYELDTFVSIVRMREYLVENSSFEYSLKYSELLNRFVK